MRDYNDQQQQQQPQRIPSVPTIATAARDAESLADLVAQHRAERERKRQQEEEQERRRIEGERADALTEFGVRLAQALGADLLDLLDPAIAYDTTRSPNGEGIASTRDADGAENGPYAEFTYAHATWRLTRESYYDGRSYRYWRLAGPNNYSVKLGADIDTVDYATALLDALADYPAWYERRQQREAERAAHATHSAASEQPLYAYATGDAPTTGHHGLIHTGNKLSITVETPEESEYGGKTEIITATVIDWTDQWMLINVDDNEKQQRLIPVARVVQITARP
jgi:hypothetical protein